MPVLTQKFGLGGLVVAVFLTTWRWLQSSPIPRIKVSENYEHSWLFILGTLKRGQGKEAVAREFIGTNELFNTVFAWLPKQRSLRVCFNFSYLIRQYAKGPRGQEAKEPR